MVSIVLGAVAVAAVIVLAARQARERRALAAEVRALRAELQAAREALARIERPSVAAPDVSRRGTEAAPAGNDDVEDAARGPRTLH